MIHLYNKIMIILMAFYNIFKILIYSFILWWAKDIIKEEDYNMNYRKLIYNYIICNY